MPNSTSAQAVQPDSVPPAPFVAPTPIRELVDRQLVGRYGASDRDAVARCVTAALAQGAILYGVNGYAGTQGYAAYVGAYRPGAAGVPGFPGVPATMRVSSITDVQRRADGIRVKGLIDSGVIYRGGYGGQAYQGPGNGGGALCHRSSQQQRPRVSLQPRQGGPRHQHAR